MQLRGKSWAPGNGVQVEEEGGTGDKESQVIWPDLEANKGERGGVKY